MKLQLIEATGNTTRVVRVYRDTTQYGRYVVQIDKDDRTLSTQFMVTHNCHDEPLVFERHQDRVGPVAYKFPKFAMNWITKHLKTVKRPLYEHIRLGSTEHNEHNDCTVVATAATCGVSYDEAHAALKKHGRKRHTGAGPHIYVKAIEQELGKKTRWFEWGEICQLARNNGARYLTSNSVVKALPPKGKYLVRSHRHIAAVVDGQMIDWTEGRRFRIVQIWEVK